MDNLHVDKNIQGDSGGICNILGNDSVCDSKQKISYEHGSYFERLTKNFPKEYGVKIKEGKLYLYISLLKIVSFM